MMSIHTNPAAFDSIKKSLVALRMPRALEMLDATLRRVEQGEITWVDAIDNLLLEELTLRDNRRVSKNSLRVHAMGEVDELKSHIGVLLCEEMPEAVRELLVEVQHQLFNLGGELSIPGFELLKADALLLLDNALAEHNAALPKLQEFILPAGNRAAAQAHVCRTVARRAERSVVALGFEEAINDAPRQFLNRLSDLMFVLARVLNRLHGGDDVYWKSERIRSGA